MGTIIKKIITHKNLHLDEIVGIWLLKKFGEARFPGINSASILFATRGEFNNQSRIRELENDGCLFIGIGGGEFDEHPTKKEGRKARECAATLVAKSIKVYDRPELKQILNYTASIDLKGGSQPMDLASIVKSIHRQYPNSPERAIEWVNIALDAKYYEQLSFFTETKEEFRAKAEIEELYLKDKKIKIVTIVSDDENISRFARSKYGCEAAVVIQRSSKGNVIIHANKQKNISLEEVAKIIRVSEQQAKGNILTNDPDKLTREGIVDGAEEWYFFKEGQMLLNGSLTAVDVQLTTLSLEQIKQAVKVGLKVDLLQPFCESYGKCLSELCSWYIWGLKRCEKFKKR